jgi:hypothetical protein
MKGWHTRFVEQVQDADAEADFIAAKGGGRNPHSRPDPAGPSHPNPALITAMEPSRRKIVWREADWAVLPVASVSSHKSMRLFWMSGMSVVALANTAPVYIRCAASLAPSR